MATALQKVLPHSVLPRAPSPNSSSPNAGVRASITQFIAASPDPSFDVERHAGGSRTLTDHTGPIEASSSHAAPPRTSTSITDTANRRGIARSTRILGADRDAQEVLALAQLKNGKIDVSFEASLFSSGAQVAGKGKGTELEQDVPLFDVDLEAGNNGLLSPGSTRKNRLFPFGTSAKADAASSTSSIPHNEDGAAAKNAAEDEDDDDYQDDAHLLGSAASTRPGYFAPGDTSFGYNNGHGIAVGFEPITLHESGWMVVSGIFVLALVLVAVLISVDVIDWPGDGIGRQ